MGEVEKPDGWVAWHPRHGTDKTSFAAKESLVAISMGDKYRNSYPGSGYIPPLDLGWRIRPVKLVYLDEEK